MSRASLISILGRRLPCTVAPHLGLSAHALQWSRLPTFDQSEPHASRNFGARPRRQSQQRLDRTEGREKRRQQQAAEEQQLTDEQLAEQDARHEEQAVKLAQHIARVRQHKRQFAPLRSFIHTTDREYHLPPPLRDQLEWLAQRHEWTKRSAERGREREPELFAAIVRSAPQLAVMQRVLAEVRERLPWLRPARVLDVGFGAGSGVWAVREVWGADAVGEYVAVESNSRMLQLGKGLTEKAELPVRHLQRLNQPLLDEQSRQAEGSAKKPPARGVVNVVMSAYGLSRLGRDKRRAQLDIMWRSVKRGGVLVIVEEGDKEGFDVVRASREYLLQRFTNKKKKSSTDASTDTTVSLSGEPTTAEAPSSIHQFLFQLPAPPSAAGVAVLKSTPVVLAPCGHDAACPQGASGVCAFGRRVLIATLPYSSPYRTFKSDDERGGILFEKYSYVVLHKGPINPPFSGSSQEQERESEMLNDVDEESEVDEDGLDMGVGQDEAAQEDGAGGEVDAAGSESMDQLEEVGEADNADVSPPLSSAPSRLLPAAFYTSRYHRVIRPPLLRSKHVTLDLCTTDAQLQRWTIPKSAGLERGYPQARDTEWGDLWNRPKVISSTQKKKAAWRQRAIEAGELQEDEDTVADGEGKRERAAVKRPERRTREAESETDDPLSSLKTGQPVHELLAALREKKRTKDQRTKQNKKPANRTAAASESGGAAPTSASRPSRDRRSATEGEDAEDVEAIDEEREEEEEDEDAMDEVDDAEDDEDEEEPDRNTFRSSARAADARRRSA